MFLSAILSGIRQWFRHHEAVRELSCLSDHELSDIGIRRHDISSVVRDRR